MGFKASGKLYKTFEAQQVTERFRKRELVVEMGDRYTQYVMFQLTGPRCELLDDFAEGDDVEVEFDLRGREWTSPKGDIKYFNSLDVRSIEKVGAGKGKSSGGPPADDEPPPPSDNDHVPF